MKKTEKPIVIEQLFDTSVENVWNAITVLDRMQQWFFNNIPSFEPVVGFETQFIIQVEDRIFPHVWKLTEVAPLKKITYDWRYEGYPGNALVTFEIIEKGHQTLVRLTSTVLEDFPDNIPEFKRESGVKGWNYFIKKSLKNYLKEREE
ncbi:MAG: SRPBCC domain-containing protein [Polaribacter sp.]|nr:SRPBCC domain-containing protein [Polaribacter sp.]